MAENRFERGAIVRCNNRTWIVWSYPRMRGHVDPWVLPVIPQTGPRHRSHVRLVLGGKRVLVQVLEHSTLPHADCVPIGQCSPATVAILGASMQRAIEADAMEQRQRIHVATAGPA